MSDQQKWAAAMLLGMLLACALGFVAGAIIGHASTAKPLGFCVVYVCTEHNGNG